jgi:hypothetical protein
VYRTTPTSSSLPPMSYVRPTTTIRPLPSIATPWPQSPPVPIAVRTLPPVPKLVSRSPGAANTAAGAARVARSSSQSTGVCFMRVM